MSVNSILQPHQWTLEIVPAHAERVKAFEGLVREIFITMIPGADNLEILNALQKVQSLGFHPVPHIAARNFRSEKDLNYFFDGIRDHGIQKVLILAGGLSDPVGSYSDSMQILRSDAFGNSGIQVVGLAGHPEGNPVDKDSRGNLKKKWQYLQQLGLGMEIVTQWSFSPDKVSEYIQSLRDEGIPAPVRVGIAGPASLKTLLKYAKLCGVTAAKEVLKKQGFSLGRLLVSNDPKRFVENVQGTDRFHLYPFGGLEKCATWLQEQAMAGVKYSDPPADEATRPVLDQSAS